MFKYLYCGCSVSKSAPTVHAHAVVAKPIVKHIVPTVHKAVYAHPEPIGKLLKFIYMCECIKRFEW